jgi:hypothetical protein
MEEHDPRAVRGAGGDLVPEHRAGVRRRQLVDVRAAEAAREHTDELALAVGLRHLLETRCSGLVDHDRAHDETLLLCIVR